MSEFKTNKAVFVGVILEKGGERKVQEYLDELAFLAETAGAIPDKMFTQRLDRPDKAPLLSSPVAYAQSPGQAEVSMNQPSVHFTMQVLYRLNFAWDHTSSKYVDMIFEMLRTLRYFD